MENATSRFLKPATLALLLPLSTPLFAADVEIGPSSATLGPNRDKHETDWYAVGSFGWMETAVDARHEPYFYPTPADAMPGGHFTLDHHNAVSADFNADGRDDLLIAWAVFPHTVPRAFRVPYTVLLNQGDDSFRAAPEIFDGTPPLRHFAYRTAVADFNLDGRPDVVSAPMGLIERLAGGGFRDAYEPIPLMLSTPSGKLRDASAQIEGQEAGGLPANFSFAHELSTGDVNGDGAPDIYAGKSLFLNDGTGRFRNATTSLPLEMRPTHTYLMTSLIGDLNGDGIGDIVAAYADGVSPGERSGYVLLSRNGDATFTNRELVELPPGRYGQGSTKFNDGAIYDVDRDGRPDIVFSITRATPYYRGRNLQVLMNRGAKGFVDETATRLHELPVLDSVQGEGTLWIVDVDADGIEDLVHSGGTSFSEAEPHGLTVYLNEGGRLEAVPFDAFPWVQPWQIKGYEDTEPYQRTGGMARAYPIDIDGRGGIDFISGVTVPLRTWPQVEPGRFVFYSVLSTDPLPHSGVDAQVASIAAEPGGVITNTGATTSARFRIGASLDRGATVQQQFSTTDFVTIAGKVLPQASDIGKEADVFVVVRATTNDSDTWAYRDREGRYHPWNEVMIPTLQPAFHTDDLREAAYGIYSGPLNAGTHRVFIGYRVAGSNVLHYTSQALRLDVSE